MPWTMTRRLTQQRKVRPVSAALSAAALDSSCPYREPSCPCQQQSCRMHWPCAPFSLWSMCTVHSFRHCLWLVLSHEMCT